VTCAAKGVKCTMYGLESLRIKETDRIMALQNELSKIGAELIEKDDKWVLEPPKRGIMYESVLVHTYDDHRMAMAFAPLACKMYVEIEDPKVVEKSYPTYWDHFKMAGFNLLLEA